MGTIAHTCTPRVRQVTVRHARGTHSGSELSIEALEEILKEQGHEPTSQLQPFVSVVVPVIDEGPVYHCIQHPPNHEGNVSHLPAMKDKCFHMGSGRMRCNIENTRECAPDCSTSRRG